MDRNDVGELLFKHGRYYGEIKNGKPNGQGTFTFHDEEVHIGNFVDGQIHGFGTQKGGKNRPGYSYAGDFRNGKKHGHGKESNGNGSHYKGYWENDLPHGNGEVSFDDGQKETGLFSQGKLIDGHITKPDGSIVRAKV